MRNSQDILNSHNLLSLGSLTVAKGSQTFLLLAVFAAFVSTQTGCQIFKRFRSTPNATPILFEQAPSQQDLIRKLNAQSDKVRQVKTNVRFSMEGLPTTLRGNLAVERPKRLRLKAGLMGVSEMGVDVGSNDQVFWVWSKANLPGQRSAIYYSDHNAFRNSNLHQSLPIDPSWLIDALGMVRFEAHERHVGPVARADGRVEIRTYKRTTQGEQLRVSVIDPKFGWINQQAFYRADGKLLAWADSIQHKYYETPGVSLPQRIELNVVQANNQKLKLTVDADDYSINSNYGDAGILWSMPNPDDVDKINLAQVSTTPAESSPAGRVNAGAYNPQINSGAANIGGALKTGRLRDPSTGIGKRNWPPRR